MCPFEHLAKTTTASSQMGLVFSGANLMAGLVGGKLMMTLTQQARQGGAAAAAEEDVI